MLVQVNIKMSPELKKLIKRAADRSGLGISGYIRMACVERIRVDGIRIPDGKKARKKGAA